MEVSIVDDVAIFKVALSADEIKDVMDRGMDKILGISAVAGKITSTWGRLKKPLRHSF